jgi:hypothetical protein
MHLLLSSGMRKAGPRRQTASAVHSTGLVAPNIGRLSRVEMLRSPRREENLWDIVVSARSPVVLLSRRKTLHQE